MSKEEIRNIAEQANARNEDTCSPVRFWIEGDRYFICNNIYEMDDIDELKEKEFVGKIQRVLAV